MTEAERSLERLLGYIGSTSLLRRALTRLPHGARVVPNMPGESEPLSVQITSAVGLLMSKGLVNEDLAKMLMEELPGRVDEIEEVMQLLAAHPSKPVRAHTGASLNSPAVFVARSSTAPSPEKEDDGVNRARSLGLQAGLGIVGAIVLILTAWAFVQSVGSVEPVAQPQSPVAPPPKQKLGRVSIKDVAATAIYGVMDGDSAGFHMAPVGDGRLLITAPNPKFYSGRQAQPGAVYLLQTPLPEVVELRSRDSYLARLIEEKDDDELGWRARGVGDVDRDGVFDFMTVSRDRDNSSDGIVYLVSGDIRGDSRIGTTNKLVLATLYAEDRGDGLGGEIHYSRVDDEQSIVLISAPNAENPGPSLDGGIVYLVNPAELRGEASIARAAVAEWIMDVGRAHIGWRIDSDDIDGDGVDDFLVNAHTACTDTDGAGAYLVLGNDKVLHGAFSLREIGIGFLDEPRKMCESDYGFDSKITGDINGDGLPDIALTSRVYDSYRGRVSLVAWGSATNRHPTPNSVANRIYDIAKLHYEGEARGDQFGFSVRWAQDLNGDAEGDLMVGAPYKSFPEVGGTKQGAVYVYLGPIESGSVEADALWYGATDNAQLGDRIEKMGDLNSDGLEDYMIGSVGESNERGAAYLLLGGSMSME